jgi:hypothetical protein
MLARDRDGDRIVARRSLGWSTGFWLTVCASLAVVVGYQLSKSFPLAPTVTAAPPGAPLLDPAERPAPPRSPASDAVRQIAARPLFSESRRAYVPPSMPVEEAATGLIRPASALELAGTFLTETDQAALLLMSGGTPAWLRKGQLIDGWEIETIEQDRVQLRKGEQRQVLHLREDLAVPQTTRPPRQTRRDDPSSGEPDGEPADVDDETNE